MLAAHTGLAVADGGEQQPLGQLVLTVCAGPRMRGAEVVPHLIEFGVGIELA